MKKVINNSFKATRGAMFGLDARIALAIFGALSVISGAALYSAIQQSKVVALVTELNEIGKAYEQYLLDTGQEISVESEGSTMTNMSIQDLVVNPGVAGWNGPYLPYGTNISKAFLSHPEFYRSSIIKISRGGTNRGTIGDYARCTAAICNVYIFMSGVPSSLAHAVDKYVDGTAGYNTGNVVLGYGFTGVSTAVNVSLGLKYMPSVN